MALTGIPGFTDNAEYLLFISSEDKLMKSVCFRVFLHSKKKYFIYNTCIINLSF